MERSTNGSQVACTNALEICERYFRLIEAALPPAQWVPWEGQHNWRFVEQLPAQALLQKMARQITGLKALRILLKAGFVQEVGVLFRMLDEISEDIAFISFGQLTNQWTKHHTEYLKYFWSEHEGDRQCPVQRKTIRAFVNRAVGLPDPYTADSVGRAIYKTYSDYIHARSLPIMAMVCGPPAYFDLDGIKNSDALRPYVAQAPSYFYRSLVGTSLIANLTTTAQIHSALYVEVKEFEAEHATALFASSDY